MKKNHYSPQFIRIIFLMLLVTLKMYALDYTISFTGTGASASVDSIIVQNLTQGTTVNVKGGNVLTLTVSPNAIDQLSASNEGIRIFPNPMQGKSTVSFYAKQAGNTQLNVFGIDGRQMIGINKNLQEGNNSFLVSLPKGIYAIQVAGNEYSYAAKVISQTNLQNKSEITFTGNEKPLSSAPQKIKSAATSMLYKEGDRLLYKGISGNYSTIVTDIPTGNKTTNFEFFDCTDTDGNHYSVVTIGNQIWMAENLKTTKYRRGENISNVTNNAEWAAVLTGAWCNYNNDAASGTKYGKLYNWYAIGDNRNIAPIGWHVSTDFEWKTLVNFLGGFSVAGGKLKETGSANWSSPNTGATNETGFSALPGGFINGNTFFNIGIYGYWWSSTTTEFDNDRAFGGILSYNFIFVNNFFNIKWLGLSVRCVRGEIQVPALTTTVASAITKTTATCGGYFANDGGGMITARGVCWSTSANPTIANTKTMDGVGTGAFTSSITGLTPETTYFVRAYAINSAGTGYSNEISFKTISLSASIPTLTTTTPYSISTTNATSGGNISSDGGATVTARGICWSTLANPTINNYKTLDGTGIGLYSRVIFGLVSGTTYYVRAYATNGNGTGYGNEVSFTTPDRLTVTDIDGNVYHTVTIGTQTWLVENLKTTKYRNGESISNVTDYAAWAAFSTGAWCDYNNETTIGTKYGKLYNWYAVADSRNIAPTGWHVPTDAEWTTLTTFLGGVSVAGGKLKEAGTVNWLSPNTGATNESSFSALPGGDREYSGGIFGSIGGECAWWSSSEFSTYEASGWFLYSNYTGVARDTSLIKLFGFSVRCIKDEEQIPILTTTAVYATTTTATCGGNITIDGFAPITERGVCWGTSANPTIANSKTTDGVGVGTFTSSITGLTPETTYHIRAYATNRIGTAYGSELVFKTISLAATIPTLTTTTPYLITSTNATSGGNISNDGGAAVTARGICWSTNSSPTISNSKTLDGNGIGLFSRVIFGLLPGTSYYVRAYATNGAGTGYGNEVSFITSNEQTVTDIEGNVYHTVTIGTQTWMAENLKTSQYRNGESISNVVGDADWASLSTGAWCYYNNDAINSTKYGKLYNWYAVADSRNIAPIGWHVATDSEWTTITTFLGGESVAGGQLKEDGTVNWTFPNIGANNERNFSSLPGGERDYTGLFYGQSYRGYWWSSTESFVFNASWSRLITNYDCNVYRSYDGRPAGFSVRCVKD